MGGMFFSFFYLAVRALVGLLVRSRRGPDAKDVELMVLRHEHESALPGRPAEASAGRPCPAGGCCLSPAAFVTRGASCHAADAAALAPGARAPEAATTRWAARTAGVVGRNSEPCSATRAREPTLGPSICGELAKLGLHVSPTSIRRLLARTGWILRRDSRARAGASSSRSRPRASSRATSSRLRPSFCVATTCCSSSARQPARLARRLNSQSGQERSA